MKIGNTVVANPTGIQVDTVYITANNLTHGGLKRHFFRSPTNQTKTLRVYRVQVNWQELAPSEYSAIQNAHLAAINDYVEIEALGINITMNGKPNTVVATADFQQPHLTAKAMQGFSGDTGEGPLLYNVNGAYISQAEEIDPPY